MDSGVPGSDLIQFGSGAGARDQLCERVVTT